MLRQSLSHNEKEKKKRDVSDARKMRRTKESTEAPAGAHAGEL